MKRISLFLLLLITMGLFAQSGDALYQKITNTYGGFSSFQASIKQDNHFAQINKSISYQGVIYFTKGRMVIRYDKPNFQRLMISNGKVDLYDQQSNTVFRSRMRPEFGKMNPVEILQHYWKKSVVTVRTDKNKLSNVTLKPIKDPIIVTLTASINPKTGIVQSLGYTDANGNKVSYSFSGIKTNAAIPASVWQYNYPKNIQVVEQ